MTLPTRLPTHHSPGHGIAAPAELVDLAVARGARTAVLTDLETLAAAVEFHERCRAAGIRPVLGVELRRGFVSVGARGDPGVGEGRLILLARGANGWGSLCRIVSRRRSAPPARAPDPVPDFLADPDGLVALSDDPDPILRLLRAGVPRESLRLLLVRPAPGTDAENELLATSRRHGIPLVADLDARAPAPGDGPAIRLALALRLGVPVHALPAVAVRPLPDPSSERRLFADVPTAVAEAEALAEECRAGISPAGGLPAPDLPPGETPDRSLAERAKRALADARAEGRLRSPAHDERLARELALVAGAGLAEWFLAVAEVVDHARAAGIPVVSRGSAVGSLVVHLLAAGPVDPVAEGLLVERFLHPGRRSPPDIDLDIPSGRRDELVAWVLRRWGARAAVVGAHQRFRIRSARREAARAAGMAPDADPRCLPPGWERLLDAPRGLCAHPGGVVLGRTAISDRVPLERAPKGFPVTQLDGRSLEALGFVKLDLLGNRSLDVIDRTVRLVSRRADPDARRIAATAIVELPVDDPATLRRLDRAETVGCAQIESPATRAALGRRRIRSLDDLTAALAAVRPGSAGDGPLFEEDAMRLLASAGRTTLKEADAWRTRIVETGGDPVALVDLGKRFLEAATGRGADPGHARRAWTEAAALARYAFSKAHASSAARLAMAAAYLRTHVPVEYGCAVLDEHGGAYLRRTIAAEVGRWGATIRAPCVNRSEPGTAPDPDRRLRLGLTRIRGLRRTTLGRLLAERTREGPFRSVNDLLRRVRPTLPEIEALIRSGACDDLEPLSAARHPFAHESVLAEVRAGRNPIEIGAGSRRLPTCAAADADRYRALVRARDELRFLGCAPSGHPLAHFRGRAGELGCRTIAEVLSSPALSAGETRIVGLPAATHRVDTARGPMRFVTWEDETGLLDAELPSRRWDLTGARFSPDRPFLVRGRLRASRPALLIASELSAFPTPAVNAPAGDAPPVDAPRVRRRTASAGARP